MKKFNEIMLPQIQQKNKVETLTRTVNSYFTVLGTEGIGEPEDHYEQLECLKHANAGETFIATFSSNPGGSYSGILAWKNALEMTEAHTIAILEGDLASAGTIIPMYFDECHVTPYTTFMCHSANFGINRNTALNVEANAVFQAKQIKRFIRDAYKYFLTEEEILKILDGAELYLDEFEIQERLTKRAELMAAEDEVEEVKAIKKKVLPKGETVFKKGMNVRSPQYGEGVVDSVSDGDDDEVHVHFKNGVDINFTLDGIDYNDWPDGEPTLEVVPVKTPAKKKAPVKKASPKKGKAFNENDDPDFEKPKAPPRALKVTK